MVRRQEGKSRALYPIEVGSPGGGDVESLGGGELGIINERGQDDGREVQVDAPVWSDSASYS